MSTAHVEVSTTQPNLGEVALSDQFKLNLPSREQALEELVRQTVQATGRQLREVQARQMITQLYKKLGIIPISVQVLDVCLNERHYRYDPVEKTIKIYQLKPAPQRNGRVEITGLEFLEALLRGFVCHYDRCRFDFGTRYQGKGFRNRLDQLRNWLGVVTVS